jgi:glycosyltransferase involved in cell wall biosynthesis
MTCLDVIEHADPRYGGIASSVPALGRALSAQGRYRPRTAAFCVPSERSDRELVRLPAGRLAWLAAPAARQTFDEAVAGADVVHVHGLWSQHMLSACRSAQRHRRPYVVSAHGMLEPWALGNKRWKKRVYGALVERSNLRRAACLRALTRQEALDYRRYGVRSPAFVVPNGIDPPPSLAPDAFLARYPELRGRRLTLFLGRLHCKKGLDLLCRAWAAVPRCPEDRLVIAGPDFENTRASLEALAAGLGISSEVVFTGLLAGDQKWSAFAAARTFVLPSYSEGFSMAVLEALAAGVPVIVSRESHPPERIHGCCGWVVPAEDAPLAAALAESLEASDADCRRFGASGRLLAQQFTWQSIAARMAAVYDWVLGGGWPSNVEYVL